MNISDRELERLSQASKLLVKVVDNGWNLPFEAIEKIKLRIIKAYLNVCRVKRNHRVEWLTAEAMHQYETKSWVWCCICVNQCIGEVSKLQQELVEGYDVTELEAINILNSRNVNQCVNKYDPFRYLSLGPQMRSGLHGGSGKSMRWHEVWL